MPVRIAVSAKAVTFAVGYRTSSRRNAVTSPGTERAVIDSSSRKYRQL